MRITPHKLFPTMTRGYTWSEAALHLETFDYFTYIKVYEECEKFKNNPWFYTCKSRAKVS